MRFHDRAERKASGRVVNNRQSKLEQYRIKSLALVVEKRKTFVFDLKVKIETVKQPQSLVQPQS